MPRSVVWQLVQGQSGGMPRIRIDNNNISYQEEIREIFQRHRVAFDERYVWD